jgi:hypothetical protein
MTRTNPKITVLDPLDTAIAEIERLVMTVAHEAVQDATPLEEKVNALKACTPYYAALIKSKNRQPDDSEESFENFASAVRGDEHGEVRGGRGRGNA